MSESKHTPGPWRAEVRADSWPNYERPDPSYHVPGIFAGDLSIPFGTEPNAVRKIATLTDAWDEQAQSDALLIAAAPDLLAVCEAIEWQYDPESDTSFCPCCKMSKERGHRGDCELSAAIRKAGGAK